MTFDLTFDLLKIIFKIPYQVLVETCDCRFAHLTKVACLRVRQGAESLRRVRSSEYPGGVPVNCFSDWNGDKACGLNKNIGHCHDLTFDTAC